VDMFDKFSYSAQKGIIWGIGKSNKLDMGLAFVLEVCACNVDVALDPNATAQISLSEPKGS